MFYIKLNEEYSKKNHSQEYNFINFVNGFLAIAKKSNSEYKLKQTTEYIFLLEGFFFEEDINCIPIASLDHIKKFLERVDGFFCLVVIEKGSGTIHTFSDHIGSKTIYFSNDNFGKYLSNDEKFFLNREQKINKEKVIDYFCFSVDAGRDTFFESINKLEPRQHIKFTKDGEFFEEYFTFKIQKDSKEEAEYIQEFKDSFLHAVKNCSINCSNTIGTALSGGLDSSSITSSLNLITNKDIYAQTVCFDGLTGSQSQKANEKNYAMEVTKNNNINHDFIHLKNIGSISQFSETTKNFTEPNGLVNGYIHSAIFRNLQKRNITNFFDGFGGDSVINHGYLHLNILAKEFKICELLKQDKLIHEKRGALDYFSSARTLKRVFLPTHLGPKIMWYLDNFRKRENRFKLWSKRINPSLRKKDIYTSLIDFYKYNPLRISVDVQLAHLRSIIGPQITASIRNAQKMADSYGIKVYFPFLSKKLIALSLNTPIELKLKNGIDRYVFRESMNGIVPNKILRRCTKSNLSPFAIREVSKLDLNQLENDLLERTDNLFNFHHIRNRVFKERNYNFVEIYQLYEFSKWLQKNNLFIK